jgi:hypothetical protein
MSSLRRNVILGLAAVAGLGFLGLPGRTAAQTSSFAFADTSVLRDTLGLHFTHLLETADSLSRACMPCDLSPDSLRAQVIRYRLPIPRLLAMADSMHVTVDSVGIYIDRERFNPLSNNYLSNGQSSFKYRTGYTIGRTTTTWQNGADFLMQRGTMLLTNTTDISIDRTKATNGLSMQQQRSSSSQATWRVSHNVSMGGVATLSGYDSIDPSGLSDQQERKSEFQFTSRSKQQFRRGVTSDLNLLAGYLDLSNSSTIKRGFSSDLNGHSRVERGNWFSHDFSADVNGNLSRTRQPQSIVTLGTHDLSGSLRGGMQVFQATPVGLNVNYQARRSSVETPTAADTVNRIVTTVANTDATLRLRMNNDRYLNLNGSAGINFSLQGNLYDKGWKADGRWVQGLWKVDANGGNSIRLSQRPRQNNGGGYDEHQDGRQAELRLERPLSRRLTARAIFDIGLDQYRSNPTADSALPPTPRDNYVQSYRVEANYVPAEKFNTTAALEVRLNRFINLPSTSTANNTDTRSYRAEWRWSYRLMRGLTAAQTNTIESDYEFYPFAPERNDLSLDYNAVTSLSAVITPRLSIDVQHNARQQPHGDWMVYPDGSGALLPSDENLNYTLNANVVWSVSPGVSLNVSPSYLASDRTGTTNGVATPTRRTRHMQINGGANLDLPLGKNGHLIGNVGRMFIDDRSTTYANGVPQPSPLAQQDFWSGSLALTWGL